MSKYMKICRPPLHRLTPGGSSGGKKQRNCVVVVIDQLFSYCVVLNLSAGTPSRTLGSISDGTRNVVAISCPPLIGIGAKFTAVKQDRASHSEVPRDEWLEGL
jgi:hypothetical protein